MKREQPNKGDHEWVYSRLNLCSVVFAAYSWLHMPSFVLRIHQLKQNDPASSLHDNRHRQEVFKFISYFVFPTFCSKSGPSFILRHNNSALFFLIFNPPFGFSLWTISTSCPVSIWSPLVPFFPPVLSPQSSWGHPKSDSGSSCQPHRLFDKHFDFLLRSFRQHSPGDRLEFPF